MTEQNQNAAPENTPEKDPSAEAVQMALAAQAAEAEQQEHAESVTPEMKAQEKAQAEEQHREELSREQSVKFTTGIIQKGLQTGVTLGVKTEMGQRINYPAEIFADTAEASAELVEHYFPGGLVAFLDRYGPWVALVTSGYMLTLTVNDIKGRCDHAEQEAYRADQQKKQEAEQKEEGKKKAGFFGGKAA